MSKHARSATISQMTKCVKKNMHNVQINLNVLPEFEQSTEFKVYRELKEVQIETSLASKSINEDKTTLQYKFDQIIDIPKKLNESFDNTLDNQYYIFGVPKQDSFFYSLLYIISKDFKMKKSDIRKSYVEALREKLLQKLGEIYKTQKYSRYNYKKSSIEENINNSSHATEGLICLMSDYFQANIVVLNYDNGKYWMGKEYNEALSEKNVVIIFSNGVYLPLIHIYGEFPDNFIYKCVVNRFKIYNKLATITDMSVVEMNVTTDNQAVSNISNAPENVNTSAVVMENSEIASTPSDLVPTPSDAVPAPSDAVPAPSKPKLRGFSGYKLPELQDLAQSYGVSICITDVERNKSKPKTKRQLYDELAKL